MVAREVLMEVLVEVEAAKDKFNKRNQIGSASRNPKKSKDTNQTPSMKKSFKIVSHIL